MKKIVIISAIILFASINFLSAQDRKEYSVLPIPSYGVEVYGSIAFQEFSSPGPNTKERRELNIQTSTASHGLTTGDIEVVVFQVEGQVIVDHFYMNIGDDIKVPIDNKQYGVAMRSSSAAIVNVFIGDELNY